MIVLASTISFGPMFGGWPDQFLIALCAVIAGANYVRHRGPVHALFLIGLLCLLVSMISYSMASNEFIRTAPLTDYPSYQPNARLMDTVFLTRGLGRLVLIVALGIELLALKKKARRTRESRRSTGVDS